MVCIAASQTHSEQIPVHLFQFKIRCGTLLSASTDGRDIWKLKLLCVEYGGGGGEFFKNFIVGKFFLGFSKFLIEKFF